MTHVAFLSALEAVPWGAAETLWHDTALTARRRGLGVSAYVKAWPELAPPYRALIEAGAALDFVGPDLAARLAAANPDIAIVNQPDAYCGVPLMQACRAAGIPHIAVTHFTAEFEWPNDAIFDAAFDAYHTARAACFVSQAGLALTERQLGGRLKNAQIVRAPFTVPYDAEPPWPAGDTLRFATVARLDPEDKGLDLIFEVLARPHWRKRPVSASIFGRGPFQRAMQRQPAYWENPAVTLAGYASEVIDIWREHHVLLLPSRAEGLPAAIVEALLCGRPVVTTDIGGNAELVREGVNGFVAPFPRADALDAALERCWNARDALATMGRDAAREIRRLVPAEPGAVFLDRILAAVP